MIYLAKVMTSLDPTKTGKVYVGSEELQVTSKPWLEVIYTTPYHSPHDRGGIHAPPVKGAEILIYKHPLFNQYYYLCTVVGGGEKKVSKSISTDDEVRTTPIVDKSNYQDLTNMVMAFKNAVDAGLEINTKRSAFNFINKAVVKTIRYLVGADASPEVQSARVENGLGDFLRITGQPKSAVTDAPLMPWRTLTSWLFGDIRLTSNRGDIYIKIDNGKDLTLENLSAGQHGASGKLGKKQGNVNIFSYHKNIHIAAKSQSSPIQGDRSGGRVVIETANSNVILTRQAITIRMKGGSSIQVTQDGVFIDGNSGPVTLTGETVNIEGTNSINLKSQQVNIAGQTVNINSAGALGIDGLPIALNSGASTGGASQAASNIESNRTPTPAVNTDESEYPYGCRFWRWWGP